MFAENGIAATSLREITSEAGANLAAVNYHFGSKAGLIEEVYGRRIRVLNTERLRLLAEARQAAGDGPLELEEILRAFVEPVRRACGDPLQGGVRFLRLMARVNMEPTADVRQLVYRQFVETGMRFHAALQEALPHLLPHEIFVRFRFALGAMFFTFAQVLDPERLGMPDCIGSGVEEHAMDDLLKFLAAGFRAPATRGGGE
jgi:AcrR family transcriptional regulator